MRHAMLLIGWCVVLHGWLATAGAQSPGSKPPREREKSIAELTAEIESGPPTGMLYASRATAYFHERKDYDKAIADYTKAIELKFPGLFYMHLMRGIAYFQGPKDYDNAIADFTKAVELSPENGALSYNNRGRVYQLRKEHSKAIADFSKAIELEPTFSLAYSNRGLSRQKLKDYRKAVADYKKAIELDPDNADARARLKVAAEAARKAGPSNPPSSKKKAKKPTAKKSAKKKTAESQP